MANLSSHERALAFETMIGKLDRAQEQAEATANTEYLEFIAEQVSDKARSLLNGEPLLEQENPDDDTAELIGAVQRITDKYEFLIPYFADWPEEEK